MEAIRDKKWIFNEIYNHLIEKHLIKNQADLAEKLRTSAPNISAARKGNERYLTDKFLMKINYHFDNIFSKEWLQTGKGEMLASSENHIQEEDSDCIPLLPVEAMAGLSIGFSNGVTLRDCRKIKSPVPGADFAIQVSGDSMEPEIRNGSYLYIKKINERVFIPWGNTVVLDTENGALVKKIFPVEGTKDFIIARSVNPAYPPYEVETRGIYGIYKVLGGSYINSTL